MLKSLGLTERDFFVKLNNRKLLEGLLLKFVDEKKIDSIIRIIDKRAKVKEDEFNDLLVETGIPLKDISKIKKILAADTIEKVEKLEKNAIAKDGFEELKAVYMLLDPKFVKIDLSTARGLAYYTNTVFEIFDSKQEFRSICGGGRYDNLVELFGGQPAPATGFAMGLSTLLLLLNKKKLVPKVSLAPDYYVAAVSENVMPQALKIVAELRKKYSVETDFLRRNLSKQISYAGTINAKKLVVIGENEVKSGKVKVKDLATGNEEEKLISEL
jgi:histidyl-tRNA synthetase